MKKSGVTILFVFIANLLLFSQQADMHFKHITSEQGLISNNASAILQDDLGFMWFGTNEGLCRFDGNSFLNFVHSESDSNTLSDNNIICMLKDSIGNFWVGTRSGLNYFDLSSYTISRMPSRFNESIGMHSIKYLSLTKNNILYISTYADSLYALNVNNYELRSYKNNPLDSTSLIDNNTNSMCVDGDNNLWIGTRKGIELLDTLTHTFKHYFTTENTGFSILGLDKNKQIVVSKNNDNNLFYKTDKGFESKSFPIPGVNAIPNLMLFVDNEQNQWMIFRDKGVIFKNAETQESILLNFDRKNPNGLNSNAITSIFEDKQGNIWIGTYEVGINFLDINRKEFVHISEESNAGFQNNRVRSIYQDSEGDIWIGSKMGGMLSNYHKKTNEFTHYKYNPDNPKALNDDFIFSITEDRPGYLWVGTAHKGLSLFNKKTGEFHNPWEKMEENHPLSSISIYALCKIDDHTLLIGTGYNGILFCNTQTYETKHYVHSGSDTTGISNFKIRALLKDKADEIWIGTDLGLNRYNKEEDNFTRFLHIPGDSSSISNDEITCLHEDSKNRFWVGTKNGLNLMNRNDHSFTSFTMEDGLPNNIICGILEDNEGELWLSTHDGLSKFNIDSLNFKNYYKEDGLQGNVFANYVYCKMNDGELYFGGNNGFNRFYPEKIKENITLPEIYITGFKISNVEVIPNELGSPLKKHITQSSEVTLNYKQNSLTFEYLALNYSSPSKNEYQYKLEGFDEKWNYVKSKREANYTNLDPGTYVFKVNASNNDKLWNHEGASIVIHILPPPWLTWWAYLSYVLITLALLFWIRRNTLNKIKKEKQRELEQQKLNFFVNVSHEFRTPISLIINPINKLMKGYHPEENEKTIATIHQSAHKLSSLVNQFLDFRKLEFGKMPLQVFEIEIVPFTRKIIGDFTELAAVKNISIQFSCNDSNIQAWVDPDKYEKVINNLLSNAIKFSNEGGEISVRLNVVFNNLDKNLLGFGLNKKVAPKRILQIEVEDTGVGIQKEHLPLVFDRFYSSAKTGTGTGIGLNYAKSLVELHSGKIGVRSEQGKGSIFTVQFPLGKEYYSTVHLSETNFDLKNYTTDIGDRESLRYELNAIDEVNEDAPTKDIEQDNNLEENQNRLILIVEDNKSLRLQLKSELQEHYRVIDAPNGVKAWEKIQKNIPDLVISDVMMPEMDGIELCHKLKTDADTCHVPVVLLTAKTLVEHRIKGYETGADDYISKPFDMHELKVRIKNIIDLRKAIKDKFLNSEDLFKVSKVADNNKDEAFLSKVVEITLEHMSNPDFTINELQDLLAMSRTSFYSKVSSLTNMSPSHFLNTIRIKHAAELLLKNELAVKEIAYTCGFSSPSYFNKVFRKVLNKTPLQYIEENS